MEKGKGEECGLFHNDLQLKQGKYFKIEKIYQQNRNLNVDLSQDILVHMLSLPCPFLIIFHN